VFSLVVSILLHTFLAYLLFSLKTSKEKEEEKPIVVSFVKPKKTTKDKNFSAKRKIPKKTKLTTPSKTVLPKKEQVKKKKTVKKSKKTVQKKKIEKKQPVKKEKRHKKVPALKKADEKKLIKEKEDKKIEKEKRLKEIKKENTLKKEKNLPIKQENVEETPQIAKNPKKEEKENKKPDVNVPLSKKVNPEKEKKEPVKQLNLTHLKGKDKIFQMQSDNKPKKEEIIVEAKDDIKKYLFYVRDKLQENLSYPLMAKRLQIEGTVIVRFVIEKDGSVNENTIKIVKSSGSKILDRQAIITVKNSIPFKPPPEGRIIIEIPVVFEIIRSYY